MKLFHMATETEWVVPTFLKRWRKLRGYTQEQLADLVEMTAPSISQIETGNQGFTGETLAKLAHALGCSPVALLAHDPSREDSFWPLLDAANRLEGERRRTLLLILKAYLGARPPEEA
jgi:transcriptional regulator with XRE-family HTH domain